jgi:hypothetical protein
VEVEQAQQLIPVMEAKEKTLYLAQLLQPEEVREVLLFLRVVQN